MIFLDPITCEAILDGQDGRCHVYGFQINNGSEALLDQAADKSLAVISWVAGITHSTHVLSEAKNNRSFDDVFRVVQGAPLPPGHFMYDVFDRIGARSRELNTKPDAERRTGLKQLAGEQVAAEAVAEWARKFKREWPTLVTWACWAAAADITRDLPQRVWAWGLLDSLAHKLFTDPPADAGEFIIPTGLLGHRLRSWVTLGRKDFILHQLNDHGGKVDVAEAYSSRAVSLVEEFLQADPTQSILFNTDIADDITATPFDTSAWPFERSKIQPEAWSLRQWIAGYRDGVHSRDRFFSLTQQQVANLLVNHLIAEQEATSMAKEIALAVQMVATGLPQAELVGPNDNHYRPESVASWLDWARCAPDGTPDATPPASSEQPMNTQSPERQKRDAQLDKLRRHLGMAKITNPEKAARLQKELDELLANP